MITEGEEFYPKIDLEDLVEETYKIYRSPGKKEKQENQMISSIDSRKSLLKNMRKLVRRDNYSGLQPSTRK
jgi:hypothetical protein